MAKRIEDGDTAAEFLGHLANASALIEATKAAFRGVIGADPLFRTEIPYNRDNAAVVITGALTSDGIMPIATPVTLEPDGDLYWSSVDGELTDNADGTFYLNIYLGIWTGVGATVEEAVWTPESTETGDPIATPQITAGSPGQGCIVDDGVNPPRYFLNMTLTAGDPVWVEIPSPAALFAADNDWTGPQVFGGGFTVNGSAVFGPLASFTYIGSEAAHRAALAGGTVSTGTGGLVRAISPTLTTPTLGAATATSMSMAAGSAALPSFTFNGDLNTGAWRPAADTWAVSTGGTERIRIGSSGMVGIGTASPAFALDVNGIVFSNNSVFIQGLNPGFWLDEQGGGAKGAYLVLDGGAIQIQRRSGGFGGYEAAPVTVEIQAPSDTFWIKSYGAIGIGTSNPSATLDVVGSIRSGTYTVATTPPHVTGAEILINNASGAAVGSVVAGTGSQLVKAASNGTQWICTAIITP